MSQSATSSSLPRVFSWCPSEREWPVIFVRTMGGFRGLCIMMSVASLKSFWKQTLLNIVLYVYRKMIMEPIFLGGGQYAGVSPVDFAFFATVFPSCISV